MNKPIAPQERKSIEAILAAEGAAGKGRSPKRVIAWSGAVALAAIVVVLAWYFGTGDAAIAYKTEPAARGNLTVIVTATGSVQPINKVDVSSELSGTVRNVLVDFNTAVKAGQLLAELDTDKLKATLDSSRARLVAARAKVADAEATLVEKSRELARKRTLAAKRISPVSDLDLAKAAHERAVASLESARAETGVAEAELKLNETNLGKASIHSPIDGVVLVRNVDPGQTVAASLQAPVLFSIAEDLKQMELQVDVDEADVGSVRVGQGATFTVDAFPGREFPATIRDVRFASETIQGVVTYKAVLNVDNSELLLRPGMTATAGIRVMEIAEALLVPNAALRYSPPAEPAGEEGSLLRRILPGPPRFRAAVAPDTAGPERTVWVLKDGAPAPLAVVVGPSDGTRTEIRDGGIEAGEQLIVDQTASGS